MFAPWSFYFDVFVVSCGRATVHKPIVSSFIGQFHVELFADDPEDLSEEIIVDKLKRSAGANYDLGR